MPEQHTPEVTPPAQNMTVRTLVGADAAYACLKGQTFTMDVLLKPGRSAATSLRETAAELRQKAADLVKRAERMEAAAQIVDAQNNARWARAKAQATAEKNSAAAAAL